VSFMIVGGGIRTDPCWRCVDDRYTLLVAKEHSVGCGRGFNYRMSFYATKLDYSIIPSNTD